MISRIVDYFLTKEVFQTKPNGAQDPSSQGLEFEELSITSGPAKLEGWFVRAQEPPSIAVLICHGTGESISDWIPVQKYLYVHGISSMTFDYAGFGGSTGRPTFDQIRQDILSAYLVFCEKAGGDAKKYLLGFSLGAETILDAYPLLDASPLVGIVLCGALASIRTLAVERKMVPSWLMPLLPDAFNNVEAAKRIKTPTLLVHSKNDEFVPFSHAEQVHGAMPTGLARLACLTSFKHNDIWEKPTDEYWQSILSFLK